MTRICAWCSTILGTIDDGDDRVTHSICPACSAKLEPEEDEVTTHVIKVDYDGEYPNTCSGNLTVRVDGVIVYNGSAYASSSGSVWFDDEWNEHAEDGDLTLDDHGRKLIAEGFNEESTKHGWPSSLLTEIIDAVEDRLGECSVCCGGCV